LIFYSRFAGSADKDVTLLSSQLFPYAREFFRETAVVLAMKPRVFTSCSLLDWS